ncbi:MAG: pyruvate kinase [Pseudomonadota bacterium]
MAELDQRGAGDIPVVAKIETAQAVRNLPEILLTALPRRPLGVMVARGDLAVEIGPERCRGGKEGDIRIIERTRQEAPQRHGRDASLLLDHVGGESDAPVIRTKRGPWRRS